MRVFVYGTLKEGFHNHRCLEGATFVKQTRLARPFRMFDTGGFPVLLPATENKPGYFPTGEVYELPEGSIGRRILARLDALEGEGRMYHRRVFLDAEGDAVSVYIGDDQVFRRLDNQPQPNTPRVIVDDEGCITYGRAA